MTLWVTRKSRMMIISQLPERSENHNHFKVPVFTSEGGGGFIHRSVSLSLVPPGFKHKTWYFQWQWLLHFPFTFMEGTVNRRLTVCVCTDTHTTALIHWVNHFNEIRQDVKSDTEIVSILKGFSSSSLMIFLNCRSYKCNPKWCILDLIIAITHTPILIFFCL